MIENLWATPVGVYDLEPTEAMTREMIDAFPERVNGANMFKFPDAFEFVRYTINEYVKMYSEEVGAGDLVNFDGFFNSHTPGQFNTPHAHPLAKVVAIYYVQAEAGHGDLLLHDPRAGVQWNNVKDVDSRGVQGYRVFKRYTPLTGRLIVFPAYTVHSVETNTLVDRPTRMSIGINFFDRTFLRNFNPKI